MNRPRAAGRPEFRHVERMIARLRMTSLLRHLPHRLVWAAYVGVNSFVSIALLALLAGVVRSPFVFPSLGPTAFLFFFTPLQKSASPRNAILGHTIGLVCGFAAFRLTGMHILGKTYPSGFDWGLLLAAALSLSATGALMVACRASHPPAGATTLIVALGILYRPWHLVVIEIAVVILAVQALLLNRLAGLDYPLWGSADERPLSPPLRP